MIYNNRLSWKQAGRHKGKLTLVTNMIKVGSDVYPKSITLTPLPGNNHFS